MFVPFETIHQKWNYVLEKPHVEFVPTRQFIEIVTMGRKKPHDGEFVPTKQFIEIVTMGRKKPHDGEFVPTKQFIENGTMGRENQGG